MTLQTALIFPALLLLLFPTDRLLPAGIELRSFNSFHTLGRQARSRPWWWVAALWLDPVRAFAGTGLLTRSLGLSFSRWDVPPTFTLSAAALVIAAGVVAQLFTRRDKDVLLPPLGYVAGVLCWVAPWYAAAIVLAMSATAMFGLRGFGAFFVAGLATVGFVTFVANAGHGWAVIAFTAFLIPALMAILSGRTFELPTYKPTRSSHHHPASEHATPARR